VTQTLPACPELRRGGRSRVRPSRKREGVFRSNLIPEINYP
jgi:hypothetical protein